MWDLTLPGYKYLGPGNHLRKGKPTSSADATAYEHDVRYDQYIKNKQNPYLRWNDADEQFVKKVKTDEYGGWIGKKAFQLKKGLYNIGAIKRLREEPNISPKNNKRLRTNEWNSRVDGQTPNEVSLPDSTSKAQVASTNAMAAKGDGAGSGNNAGLKETPIDNPYQVFRGPPDYTFASLPFVETRTYTLSDVHSFDQVFRMTSVYDCRLEMTTSDVNTGAGTTTVSVESEASQRKARWFDYYSGLYNYYHVIGCQYNVFIENLSMEPLWVYQLFYNDTQPTPGATNEDMQLWSNTKYHYLDRRALAIVTAGVAETAGEMPENEAMDEGQTDTAAAQNFETTNMVSNNGNSKCVFSGEYKPGMFTREIRLDSEVENWTAVTTNPSLPEKMLIRYRPVTDTTYTNSASTSGDDMKFKVIVKLNYLVEFKELNAALRYPVQRQPVTVTLASSLSSTN